MSIRHFGIDVHKNFVVVAAVNSQQEVVQPAMRVEMPVLEKWIQQTLSHQDRCVIEVTNSRYADKRIVCKSSKASKAVRNAFM